MTEREAANGLIELQTENAKRAKAYAKYAYVWKDMGISDPAMEAEARKEMVETARKILRLLTRIRIEEIRISPLEHPEAARIVKESAEFLENRVECFAFKDLGYGAYRDEDRRIFFRMDASRMR